MKFIREKFNKVFRPNRERLLRAIMEGSLADVQNVLRKRPALNFEEGLPLFLAVETNDAEKTRALIDAGADPQRCSGGIVAIAAMRGDIEMLTMLLDAGADPSSRSCSALYWSCKLGKSESVKLLFEHGAEACVSTLRKAWQSGCPETIDLVLDHFKDMDMIEWEIGCHRDPNGKSSVHPHLLARYEQMKSNLRTRTAPKVIPATP
ncbi:MAG: ankyrin repeat domain-containing protein [Pseudomonadota bacterium]